MNQPDEHDDLWRLLGKAKEPAVSPFFARNVLRDVRALRQEQPGVFGWLRRRWQVALVGACAACLSGLMLLQRAAPQPDQLSLIASEVSESPDYLVITELDELLASEESSVWLDKPVY
jgi:hypothetical protein